MRASLACCLAASFVAAARAQQPQQTPAATPPPQTQPAPSPQPSATPADTGAAAQARIARARGLAVTGNFTAAAELEAARSEAQADDAARDVASILLMGVYLWQGNYTRADALLGESFDQAQGPRDEKATRLYFALAGQTVNGVRSRLERYRDFGLNHAGIDLPAEARADAAQMRSLLERVVEQARQIAEANARSLATDAVALLEDAAAVRLSLARTDNDRTRWQRTLADARQRLVASESRRRGVVAAGRPGGGAPGANPNSAASSNRGAAEAGGNVAAPAKQPVPATANAGSASQTPPPQTPAGGTSANDSPSQPQQGAVPSTGVGNGAAGKPSSPVSVGSLADRATEKFQPSYPPAARQVGARGVVTVYLLVNEKGQVESIERASGHPLLQNSAKEAARRWKFRPTLVNGQPVRVSGYISFNFAI